MSDTLPALLAHAETLASRLPRLRVLTRPSARMHAGHAGNRRAGSGEEFWQYRVHRPEDGATRIDWRRSARGDRMYVRETEQETARNFLFWVDPSKGFDWSSEKKQPSKRDTAITICMALTRLLTAADERCGVIGQDSQPTTGAATTSNVGQRLLALSDTLPTPKPSIERAFVVIASDFYGDMHKWNETINRLAQEGYDGLLLSISDPAEVIYPYEGRVRFSNLSQARDLLLGRAENVRSKYLERFGQRKKDIATLAQTVHWAHMDFTTHTDATDLLRQICAHISEARE